MAHTDPLFTLPVVALLLLAFVLGTSEFIVIGILPDLAADLQVHLAIAGGLGVSVCIRARGRDGSSDISNGAGESPDAGFGAGDCVYHRQSDRLRR